MRRFFSELKRRKVYRVAIAYAVAAWLVAQVVTQIFPVFEVSQWALRSMIVLLIWVPDRFDPGVGVRHHAARNQTDLMSILRKRMRVAWKRFRQKVSQCCHSKI
jgi:hypothetical protein